MFYLSGVVVYVFVEIDDLDIIKMVFNNKCVLLELEIVDIVLICSKYILDYCVLLVEC